MFRLFKQKHIRNDHSIRNADLERDPNKSAKARYLNCHLPWGLHHPGCGDRGRGEAREIFIRVANWTGSQPYWRIPAEPIVRWHGYRTEKHVIVRLMESQFSRDLAREGG